MTENDHYPRPVSDPAADGLPEVADADSSASDEIEAARVSEGPEPSPLPPDREEGPLALNEFGTTPAEERRGESLAGRLAREVPDVTDESVEVEPEPKLAEESDADALDQLAEDSELLAEDEPTDAHLGSPVSVYDRPISGVPSTGRIGRLVQPDEGGYADSEADEVAYDAGASGGGASAEEAAVHQVPSGDEPRMWPAEEPADAQPGRRPHRYRTGAEQPWEPEDLAVAEGRDPTPENVARARRELDELGPAAIEKTVP